MKTTTAPLNKTRMRTLRVGFVPLVDCAPLVMAQELGLFARNGLSVQLSREIGWATIRDKIIYDETQSIKEPISVAT
jgi:ABC-type nitrate/sulfonate/bicarbonate transport system substrate-binding protein